jgi:hypothetical protein
LASRLIQILAQEVIDNSDDEPVAGHATTINVVLYKDGSLSVEDDGRGEVARTQDVLGAEGISGRVKFLLLAWAGMPKTSFRKNSDSNHANLTP